MKSPEYEHNETSAESEHWHISREQLDRMSPSELADAMERALDDMTEETYDPEVIQAYLNALENKTPVPPHPDAEESRRELERKIQSIREDPSTERQAGMKRAVRLRSILRVSLAAALLTACLFGAMVAAQAAGIDVFGAVARWTEDVFSFGNIPAQSGPGTTTTTLSEQPDLQEPLSEKAAEIPEEAEEMQAILEEDGQVLYFPQIPKNFNLASSQLFVDPRTQEATFIVMYERQDQYIGFQIIQYNSRPPATVHEKDGTPVQEYEINGIKHYILSNNGAVSAAWMQNNVEYSLWTNSNDIDMESLLQTLY